MLHLLTAGVSVEDVDRRRAGREVRPLALEGVGFLTENVVQGERQGCAVECGFHHRITDSHATIGVVHVGTGVGKDLCRFLDGNVHADFGEPDLGLAADPFG